MRLREPVVLLLLLVAVWLFPAAPARADGDDTQGDGEAQPVTLATVCEAFADFDLNDDGVIEIHHLQTVPGETEVAADKPLVVVLIEQRLLDPLDGGADLRPVLDRYIADLRADGWRAQLVAASVYAGERHQDGRTLLAMRRFLQRLRDDVGPLAGAVLVGSFPEALLMRNYNWRKRGNIKVNGETHRNVHYLRCVPEIVAHRAEIVLADLDGRWESRYFEAPTRLPRLIAVYDGSVPRQGISKHWQISHSTHADFFYVNDAHYETAEVQDTDGNVTGLDVRILDDHENDECSDADRARRNPLPIPDISVSRINPRWIATRPKAGVVGVNGEHLLDADGRPQAVDFGAANKVPKWLSIWEPDPRLERQLLVEYFERNHRWRQGLPATAWKPATIAKDLGNGFRAARTARPEWRELEAQGVQRHHNATILEYARWLQQPAVVRDIRGHSDKWGTVFGRADLDELREVVGPAFTWSKSGTKLVPSIKSACGGGKADFGLYRTLWANGRISPVPWIAVHTGCETISPPGATRVPYNHPGYGAWAGGESLLFYGGGLAMISRAKVFYDSPRGFYGVLASGGTFGDGWRRYFEVEADDQRPGGGIGRKRATFWSVLGDWTLRLPDGPRRDAE